MPKVQRSFGYAASLVALLVVIGACSAGAPAASPSPSGPSPLVGTSWNLTMLGNAAPTSSATLTFTDDNAGGLAGCNTFTASYTADASALKFGPVALTRMACEPGVTTFESAYISALANTTQVHDDAPTSSTLQSGGGEALLTYAAGSPTDIEGSWDGDRFNNGSAIVSVALGSTITMDFDNDGQVSGNGGCNQYSGGYSVDGSQHQHRPIAVDDDGLPRRGRWYAGGPVPRGAGHGRDMVAHRSSSSSAAWPGRDDPGQRERERRRGVTTPATPPRGRSRQTRARQHPCRGQCWYWSSAHRSSRERSRRSSRRSEACSSVR